MTTYYTNAYLNERSLKVDSHDGPFETLAEVIKDAVSYVGRYNYTYLATLSNGPDVTEEVREAISCLDDDEDDDGSYAAEVRDLCGL